MTGLEAFRLSMSVLFMLLMVVMAIVMWRNASNTSDLLRQGQEDKKAREQALLELQKTADALALETQKAVGDANVQRESLSDKIDKNTELTTEAVEVVKDVNEKVTLLSKNGKDDKAN